MFSLTLHRIKQVHKINGRINYMLMLLELIPAASKKKLEIISKSLIQEEIAHIIEGVSADRFTMLAKFTWHSSSFQTLGVCLGGCCVPQIILTFFQAVFLCE